MWVMRVLALDLTPIPSPHVGDTSPGRAADDSLVVLASDGLFANSERGGGGGLSNQEVVELAQRAADPEEAAAKLAQAAQDAGSTDDITVVVLRLK